MAKETLLRKIYWTLAVLSAFILAFLVSVIFLNPSSVGNTDFVENINLWASIWTVNTVLLLALCFMLARDLIKLYFEHQSKKLGTRIKRKLITTFTIFSLFPALLMSFVAFGLINSNLRLWFTSPSEKLLTSSEKVVEAYYDQNQSLLLYKTQLVASLINPSTLQWDPAGLDQDLSEIQGLAIFDSQGIRTSQDRWREEDVTDLLSQALGGKDVYSRRRGHEIGRADVDLILTGRPIRNSGEEIVGAVLAQHVVPGSVEFNALEATNARRKFNDLKNSFRQVQLNYFLILAITTLMVISGFVWLGTYIARKITVPLEGLAEGADQLSQGNLDHRVNVAAVDELGVLVDSFNTMAGDIRNSRRQLEETNAELRAANKELQEGRSYTEHILQNIGTGVLSIDQNDIVQTGNQAALRILKMSNSEVVGHQIGSLAGETFLEQFQEMKRRAKLYGSYRRELVLKRGKFQTCIAATVTVSPQPLRNNQEFLVVLDELNELIRAEKFAAWQEVARRLAHEIKNPLTPIQLSAERILKRFEKLELSDGTAVRNFRKVLEDGVRMISTEGQNLKSLVQEFSRFARLPISKPVDTPLHHLIDETLKMYDGALKNIQVDRSFDNQVSKVLVDPEQIRRVFVNLIDNAMDALSDTENGRRLSISTRLNTRKQSVAVEFRDNGGGVPPEDYDNLFLPYFSTKKKGTGLGLAIVQRIINDHNGYIRAEPNFPNGMCFTMEIPLAETSTNSEGHS
jgi:two-component system nitrogen regulation sensor histidine kinase NtrY